MNREEAQNKKRIDYFVGHTAYTDSMGIGMVKKLINNIYDDLESRTCENCKLDGRCTIQNAFSEYTESITGNKASNFNTFGCNKFERKQ